MSFFAWKNTPFRETRISRLSDGAEYTRDHSSFEDFFPQQAESNFSKMPYKTFEQFLKKADSSYYEGDLPDKKENRRTPDMRWSHYSARDHEFGRPYSVVGEEFFSRLVKEIIALSQQPWVWGKDFARRHWERHQYVVQRKMRGLADQNFDGKVDFPALVPIEKYDSFHAGFKDLPANAVKRSYEIHHIRWDFESKGG